MEENKRENKEKKMKDKTKISSKNCWKNGGWKK
jgi:hypothetical protein